MTKKKYVKPEMTMEGFVPEQYVAACEVETGSIFTGQLECGADVELKITGKGSNDNTFYATPQNSGSTSSNQEMLYVATNGDYVYCGSIDTGHTDGTKPGDYLPIQNGVQANVGDKTSNGQEYCSHILPVAAAHHHFQYLTISNKNNS